MRPNRKEINWIAADVDDPYVVFNLGDVITQFDPKVDYGLLMVTGGVFPSVNQARKNGYSGPVPFGYTELRLNGFDIYIYNPDYNWKKIDPDDPNQYGPFVYVDPLTEEHLRALGFWQKEHPPSWQRAR